MAKTSAPKVQKSKKKSGKGARGLGDVEVDKNLRFRKKFRSFFDQKIDVFFQIFSGRTLLS